MSLPLGIRASDRRPRTQNRRLAPTGRWEFGHAHVGGLALPLEFLLFLALKADFS